MTKRIWRLDDGVTILKWRMTVNCVEYLRYEKNEPLEGGDFTSHKSLKMAKQYRSQN